jgi:hypothetical protein
MKQWIATVAAAVLVVGIGGYAIFLTAKSQDPPPLSAHEPVWTEAAWPFPIDQWGQGWAYQMQGRRLRGRGQSLPPAENRLLQRQTGVADDAELDRVSDLDLFGSERSALTPGQPITVHWMKGRSRGYKVGRASGKSVLALAFNDKCDVIVATVIAGDEPAAQEQAVLQFLNGDLVMHWAEQVLGL